MQPTVRTGDQALAAHPATRESFEPYGRLVAPGARAILGRKRRVLVTQERRRPTRTRVTELVRHPGAHRLVQPVGRAPCWIVVGRGAEGPDLVVDAFLLGGGTGVLLDPGVWHAGPHPLEELAFTEVLEIAGVADRYDRRSVQALAGVPAVDVVLPEELGARSGGLPLTAPGTVVFDAALHGRMRLACLLLEDLAPGDDTALEAELRQTVEGLRSVWGRATDLGEIPGIAVGRALYRELGLDPARHVPRSEALLAAALAGDAVPAEGVLARALALVALRTPVPLAAYDATVLAQPVHVRLGLPGEGHAIADGTRVALEGRPALCGPDGPFGSPLGDAPEAAAGPRTRRALVVLYLPAGTDDGTVGPWLDAIARTVGAHAGGHEGGRLLVG